MARLGLEALGAITPKTMAAKDLAFACFAEIFGDSIPWQTEVATRIKAHVASGHYASIDDEIFQLTKNKLKANKGYSYILTYYIYIAAHSGDVTAEHREACGLALNRLSRALWGGKSAEERYREIKNGDRPPQPRLHFPKERLAKAPAGREADGAASWLSPLAIDALAFVGREAELAALGAFWNRPEPFLVWGVSGPSGAGKTRLAVEWMRVLRRVHADAGVIEVNIGFLTASTLEAWRKEGGSWADWTPDRPTFIALDYLHLFHDDIRTLLARGLESGSTFTHPVRILLIDHILPDDLRALFKDPRLSGLAGEGIFDDRMPILFHDRRPLHLRPGDQSGATLFRIMCNAAAIHGIQLDARTAQAAMRELKVIRGAWCPLFAALRGRALAIDPVRRFSGRQDLIASYLDTANRLPWWNANAAAASNGLWAGCLVAAATATRGASIEDLTDGLPQHVHAAPPERRHAVTLSRWIVSGVDPLHLPPFEPDILGEAFLLLFWKEAVEAGSTVTSAFVRMCGRVCENEAAKSREFVGFVDRLLRNLRNDALEESFAFWQLLPSLLSPARHPSGSLMRQAACIGFLRYQEEWREVVAGEGHALSPQDSEPTDVGVVDIEDLVAACEGPLMVEAITALMRLYGRRCRNGLGDKTFAEVLLAAIETVCGRLGAQSNRDISPLFLACEIGEPAVVELLLERADVDINQGTGDGYSPLFVASQLGHEGVVAQLLSRAGIDVNLAQPEGFSPLHIAVQNGHHHVLSLLLARPDLDINAVTDRGATALYWACQNADETVAAHLIAHPRIDIDRATDEQVTPLYLACQGGCVGLVRLLLRHQAIDINRPIADGTTPLAVACQHGHAEIVALLLAEPTIDPNRQRWDGVTPLYLACKNGHLDVVVLLTAHQSTDLNLSDNDGAVPLLLAASRNHLEIVAYLLDRDDRIDVNAATRQGETPLIWACYHGYTAITALLLSRPDIKINQTSTTGATPLAVALHQGHGEIVMALQAHARSARR